MIQVDGLYGVYVVIVVLGWLLVLMLVYWRVLLLVFLLIVWLWLMVSLCGSEMNCELNWIV